MNAHKWVHPNYQHVDGSSVSAAFVSGVVAQMIEANPHLAPATLREILCESALALPHLPADAAGAGLIQPTLAVAAALRRAGGPLTAYPRSGAVLREDELHDQMQRARVPLLKLDTRTGAQGERAVYCGLYAPLAATVHVTGDFNHWQADNLPLARTEVGWWHAVLLLPNGEHAYRLIVTGADSKRRWMPDPENPLRAESGYLDAHSRFVVD